MEIAGIRARLHDENVGAANIFENLKMRFAVAELAELGFAQFHTCVLADVLSQTQVGAAGENLEFVVNHCCEIKPVPSHILITRWLVRPGCGGPVSA